MQIVQNYGTYYTLTTALFSWEFEISWGGTPLLRPLNSIVFYADCLLLHLDEPRHWVPVWSTMSIMWYRRMAKRVFCGSLWLCPPSSERNTIQFILLHPDLHLCRSIQEMLNFIEVSCVLSRFPIDILHGQVLLLATGHTYTDVLEVPKKINLSVKRILCVWHLYI